jgi:hypothetical protein
LLGLYKKLLILGVLSIKRKALLVKTSLIAIILFLVLTSAAVAQAAQTKDELRKKGAERTSEVAIPKRFSWEVPGWEAIFAALGVGYYALASLLLPHLIEVESKSKEEESDEAAASGRDFSHRYSANPHS